MAGAAGRAPTFGPQRGAAGGGKDRPVTREKSKQASAAEFLADWRAAGRRATTLSRLSSRRGPADRRPPRSPEVPT